MIDDIQTVETSEPTPSIAITAKKPAKKPAPKKKPAVGSETVTLRQICDELKVDPMTARVKLRRAVADKKIKHAPKSAWEWAKGSDALAAARKVLKGD